MPSISLISIPLFNDELVFPFIGDWRDARSAGCAKVLSGLESDSGLASVTSLQRSVTRSVIVREKLWSRRAIVTAQQFIAETGGRVKRFWMPTLKRDFILNGDQSAGYFLQCLPSQYNATTDETSLEHPAILVVDPESVRWHVRQLVAVTADGEDNETLQVAGPIPAISGGSMISLLTLARFSTEDIELDMRHTEDAAVEFHVESLPEETVALAITSSGADGDIVDSDGTLILHPDV